MVGAVSSAVQIVVTVGTDFHHFDRLVEWIERWAGNNAGVAEVTVQHGTTRAPRGCHTASMFTHPELVSLMKTADVVVVQGGPGGIIDALSIGIRPIVVPRRHDMGEHVDDHQVAFARFMGKRGEVLVAEDEETLAELLDRAVADRGAFRVPPREPRGPETARRIGEMIGALVGEPSKASTRA